MPGARRKPEVHAVYNAMDFNRSPLWRWDRVNYLLKSRNRKPVAGMDDETIVEAYKFLKKWRRIDNATGYDNEYEREMYRRETLYFDNPGLYHAYELFLNGPERRAQELEAWILTREEDPQIAERLGVLPHFVDWYERLFFNVRDRLHISSYINHVIDRATNQGLADLNYTNIAKFFAYHSGPIVLEILLEGFDKALSAPGGGQTQDEFFASYIISNIHQRVGMSINAHEINNWSIDKLLEVFIRLRELAQKDDEAQGKIDTYGEITEIVTDTIGWAVGRDPKSALSDNGLAPYLGQAAEPRVAEMMQIAQGHQPYQPEFLEGKTVPPPRRAENDEETDETE